MTDTRSSPGSAGLREAMELAKNIIHGPMHVATRERNYAKVAEYQSYIDTIDAALGDIGKERQVIPNILIDSRGNDIYDPKDLGIGGAAQRPLDRKTLDELIQRHASAYVSRGSAISDSIIAECKASREALLAAFSAVPPSPVAGEARPSKFSPGDPVEVREIADEIDEIVIRRGDVHIEQMDDSGWFMGVDASDGSYWQFWFGAKNRKSHVHFRHTETVSSTNREGGK